MDRNTIIGFLLIGVIIIGYSLYNKPSQEEIDKANRRRDSLERIKEEAELRKQQQEALDLAESSKIAEEENLEEQEEQAMDMLEKQYGTFATAAKGENEFVTIESDMIKLKVSTKGGRPYSVELKEFKTYEQDPLILFDGDSTVFGFTFFSSNNRPISTNDLYFQPQENDYQIFADNEEKSLTMRLNAGPESYIEYVYTLTPGTYEVGFDVNFVGTEDMIAGNLSVIDLNWEFYSPQHEKGVENENNYTTFGYKYFQDDVKYVNARGKDDAEEEITTRMEWLAFQEQFFSIILRTEEPFINGMVQFKSIAEQTDKYLKFFDAELGVPLEGDSDISIPMHFYFGPSHFNTLKEYGHSYEELVPLGWGIFGWVSRYAVIPVFNFLDNFIKSYGLIILILTILIKLVLFPLTFKSYLSTAKMRVLKPEIAEINKKYPKKEDSMKKQQATMNLYKKAGVNPMGGCLPILIQFPILIAMFRFFPASFELRQKSFLWADDLSSYDSIIDLPFEIPWYGDHVSLFTLLMAVALVFTSRLNSSQMGDANQQMPGMKFMMMYMMPVMLLIFFNNYSAGLSYYYFLSNVFTLGQTLFIRRFVDDEEIHKKIKENKKKPTKKSKWQARIEEAAKKKGYDPKKK